MESKQIRNVEELTSDYACELFLFLIETAGDK